jgi:hypothetical protein
MSSNRYECPMSLIIILPVPIASQNPEMMSSSNRLFLWPRSARDKNHNHKSHPLPVQRKYGIQGEVGSVKIRTRRKTQDYFTLRASFGQASTHLLHPVHFSLSTTAIPWSFKEIALTGHFSTQASQPVHFCSSTTAGINLATAKAEPIRRQRTANAANNLR